jgi:hypothetical protein
LAPVDVEELARYLPDVVKAAKTAGLDATVRVTLDVHVRGVTGEQNATVEQINGLLKRIKDNLELA